MLPTIAVLSVMLVCVASQAPVYNTHINSGCGCGNSQNDAVIFSVGRKAGFIPTSKVIIPMDYVWTNKGGHFDMSTNRFTAPVSGRYSFSYGAGSVRGYAVQLLLYAGNPEVLVGESWDHGTIYNGVAGKTVLELKAKDTVSLGSWGNSGQGYRYLARNPPGTYFSGYLMQRDE